jgi:Domain of unknown function (DUF929)
MVGSGPDDGDILEMGSQRRRRQWVPARRSRLVLVIAGACALLAVGGTLTALRLDSRTPADPALARLISEVTTVPVNAGEPGNLNVDWSGNSSSASITSLAFDFGPISVSGPPLTVGVKPEVLYVATEYCPYCVAQNWALIVALSRFGQFTGLTTSRSPKFEDVPPIDTWTFYGSSYTSPYLAFVPVETRSNVLVSPKANKEVAASYRVLQRLTAAEQAVFDKYDNQGSTPFIDFADQAVQTGSGILANLVAGNTWQQLAADLRHPETLEGATLLNEADTLTAELCVLTGGRPAAACAQFPGPAQPGR